ncbi:MAG: GNAT family N-acetyltransferase [Euryarchaeota archaeon]|nr:GNAT family N-acetyltransferase [Euryarchaeota archaeon]
MLLRPVEPEDKPLLEEHHKSLSPETLYLRFFGPRGPLSPGELRRFTEVDHRCREAIVALDPTGERILGVARYEALPGIPEADFAVVVRDGYPGLGLGTHLLLRLASLARDRGLRRLRAAVLAENHMMMDVMRHLGFPLEAHLYAGTYEVSLDITEEPAGPSPCPAKPPMSLVARKSAQSA